MWNIYLWTLKVPDDQRIFTININNSVVETKARKILDCLCGIYFKIIVYIVLQQHLSFIVRMTMRNTL